MSYHTDHRYPLALVDKVLDEVPLKKVVAIKNISFNEKIFLGHFPNKPIYPAVYIVEGLCQCAQIMLGAQVAVTAKLEDFKFFQQVVPGDQLKYEVNLEEMIGQFQIAKGKVYVGQTVVAKGKIIGCSQDSKA
jgi:3-hydroxyacyl-[acyl-carrier-protein] dehydratase